MNSNHGNIIVIIPYYQGTDYINACVSSILDDSSVHVLIVDNDSSPDTVETQNEIVQVIKTQPAIGFARAVNVGLHWANKKGYEKMVILNQDTVVQPNCLSDLVSHLSSNHDHVIIPVIQGYGHSNMSTHFVSRTWEHKQPLKELPGLYSVNVASAACIALHRDTLQRVGYFDPLFHMYGEDDDWFHRLHSIGGKIILSDKANIQHAHSLQNSPEERNQNIQSWQFYALTILGIRYDNKRFGFLIKRTLLSIWRYRSGNLFYAHFKLIFKYNYLKKIETSKINDLALHYISKDLNSPSVSLNDHY